VVENTRFVKVVTFMLYGEEEMDILCVKRHSELSPVRTTTIDDFEVIASVYGFWIVLISTALRMKSR
jgi:hypothetical protein